MNTVYECLTPTCICTAATTGSPPEMPCISCGEYNWAPAPQRTPEEFAAWAEERRKRARGERER